MSRYFIIDGHCDTLSKMLEEESDNLTVEKGRHVSIKRLKDGNVGIQFFAAWSGGKVNSFLQRGLNLIDTYYRILKNYPDDFYPIRSFKDIKNFSDTDKIGTLLTVEGGEMLEGRISNLHSLYDLGVRSITLTWNHRNEIGCGIIERENDSGLSRFGREVVAEMNRLGMIIDVSHLSPRSFWDVIENSKSPVVATHSNARKVCPHPRNLDDEQIKALAQKKGIIGINFFSGFLSQNKNATLSDIIRHIEYIAQLVGIDFIGFGSDFDGIDVLPDGIEGPHHFPEIINTLLRLNYKEEDVLKICNRNYLRVLKDILPQN